jgi:hypothetical protein
MPRRADRADDEMHLKWIAMRVNGVSAEDIGLRFARTASHVRVATNRVMSDDLTHCGPVDNGEDVRRAYW